ncbi:MAG: FliM/FliN family flagellar motor C-terminal domain-containing protein [Phycisphaerales bacterium JB038]
MADLEHTMKLEVPVIVQIAERQMSLREVIAWGPGAIIELNKTVDDELRLQVNNVPIGTGSAYKIGENFGIKISFVGDLRSRIQALGGPMASEETAAVGDEPDVEALADQFLAGQL